MYPNIEKDYSYSSFSKQLLIAIFFLNLFLVFTGSYIRTFIDDNLLKELDYFIRMEKYVTENRISKIYASSIWIYYAGMFSGAYGIIISIKVIHQMLC